MKKMPEGFAELLEFLNPGKEYKTHEIQAALKEKHGWTSGKIAGTLKRATEHGLVTNTSRSVYKLNKSEIHAHTASSVISGCKDEVRACISKIEAIVAKNLADIEDDELARVRNLMRDLKELTAA